MSSIYAHIFRIIFNFLAASDNKQDIYILYPDKTNGFNDDFQRIAYSNFGYDDTPHGINGTLTANIKQIATELLQARNCMNRVHSAMFGIMGMQEGLAVTGKQQPQIFVDGMNKAFNLFEATRKALTEAVSILCNIVDFTPAEQSAAIAIGGGQNDG